MEKRVFGELELEILQILQTQKHPLTVHEVLQALGHKDKYTTIMTVLNRLVAKGDVQRERDGRSYRYILAESKTSLGLFEKLRQKIFGSKPSLLISYLLESTPALSQDELQQIERLLEEAKKRGKN